LGYSRTVRMGCCWCWGFPPIFSSMLPHHPHAPPSSVASWKCHLHPLLPPLTLSTLPQQVPLASYSPKREWIVPSVYTAVERFPSTQVIFCGSKWDNNYSLTQNSLDKSFIFYPNLTRQLASFYMLTWRNFGNAPYYYFHAQVYTM